MSAVLFIQISRQPDLNQRKPKFLIDMVFDLPPGGERQYFDLLVRPAMHGNDFLWKFKTINRDANLIIQNKFWRII